MESGAQDLIRKMAFNPNGCLILAAGSESCRGLKHQNASSGLSIPTNGPFAIELLLTQVKHVRKEPYPTQPSVGLQHHQELRARQRHSRDGATTALALSVRLATQVLAQQRRGALQTGRWNTRCSGARPQWAVVQGRCMSVETCQSNAGTFATVSVASCSGDNPQALSDLVLPLTAAATATTATASAYTITSYQIWAPMVELRWQSTDLPASFTSAPTNSRSTGSGSISRSGTNSPSSTDGTSSVAQVHTGLSTGEQVAIGLVVPLIVLALLALISAFIWRRRRTSVAQTSLDQTQHRMLDPGDKPLYEMEDSRQAQELQAHSSSFHELLGNTPEPPVRQLYELPTSPRLVSQTGDQQRDLLTGD
nr:hypothetical protein CFP56_26011 [Quercus suber]